MRLQHAMPVLATVVALTATTAPANAFDNREPELGPTFASHGSSSGSGNAAVDIGAALIAGAAIGAGGYAAAGRLSSRAESRRRGVATGQH